MLEHRAAVPRAPERSGQKMWTPSPVRRASSTSRGKHCCASWRWPCVGASARSTETRLCPARGQM